MSTARGKVIFRAAAPWPETLILHGFQRGVGHLADWWDRFPAVGFASLPGHGGAPELDEVSLAAWIDAWSEAVARWPRPPVVIGESLGGLVAMALPARAVVAIDPPLSVDQLWPQRKTIERAAALGEPIDPRYAALFDSPFHWVLDRIQAPALVIAGDEPLLPERPIDESPSLLGDADFALLAAHARIEAHRIAGGHALMSRNPEGVLALARPFLARV